MAPGWLDELDLRADGPPWLAMGLRRVTEDEWLLADEHRADELALRASLLATRRPEVVHLGPGTEAAGAEALALVQGWLSGHGLPSGPVDADEHPLVAAGRLVQEDLCLMVPRDDRHHVHRPHPPPSSPRLRRPVHHLDAAVLCFPSHWRLADKAGRPAAALHGPVPRYDDELAVRVDRYLDRLRPGVIGLRRNWSVHDSPALFAPDPPSDPRPVDDVAGDLWLRSERQTLRTLPATGAVLFTIRVQQAPFGVLAERPDVAAALALRLRAQPAELVEMNGLAPHLPAVLAWIDRRVAG